MSKPTIVVDSNNICWKAKYTTGVLDNGIIFGFLRQLLTMAEKFQTNRFVFCWDSRQSYRKIQSPTYKANRRKEQTPEEQEESKLAFMQFKRLRTEILPDMGFKSSFMQTGYEADDLIAHVVQKFPDYYVIASGDEDLFQLLFDGSLFYKKHGHSTSMWNGKKLTTYIDFKNDHLDISPDEWHIVKAMAGCLSDNIAGIKGVGELSAIKYLVGKLPKGKIKELIESKEGEKTIRETLPLVTLPFTGSVPIGITQLEESTLYTLDFMDEFTKLEIGSFLADDQMEKWVTNFDLKGGRC